MSAPSRRGPRALVVLLVLLAVVLAACDGGGGGKDSGAARKGRGTTSTSTAGAAALRWRGCGDGVECATLRVPLDHTRPGGSQVSLAVLRVPAADQSSRIGSLVVNPGGPGAPGTETARVLAPLLPKELTDRFDIVGWDPRGTGGSSHVRCGNRLDYLFAADTAPDTPAEQADLERVSKRLATDCARGSGDLLAHISTQDTARDLDRLRAALGDERLTYLGYSYGTYIGAVYASLFPERVRALVLDGAVDPARPGEAITLEQAQGLGRALNGFFAWCRGRRSCALRSPDPRQRYEALRQRIEATPIVQGGRTFGPTQLDLAVGAALYLGADGYSTLELALSELEQGKADMGFRLFDTYVGRSASGRYDDTWAAFIAISCLDGPPMGDATALAAMQQRFATSAGDFGPASVGLGFPCAYWKVPPVNAAPAPVRAGAGAPPIVVVGTRDDPVTPLAWARSLASELGVGRLVTAPGAQHTAFPRQDRCLDPAIVRYFVDGTAPEDGLTCG